MNRAELHADIFKLPVSDRIELVSEIWDSIDQESLPPMTEAERELIRERLDEHRANPESGISLDEFKLKINGNG